MRAFTSLFLLLLTHTYTQLVESSFGRDLQSENPWKKKKRRNGLECHKFDSREFSVSPIYLPKGWSIGGVTYLLDRISYHLQDNARIPPLDINPHLKGKGGHKVKIRAILPLSHISCLICFYKTRVHKWLLTIGCLFKILIFNLLQCSSLTHDYIDFFRQTDQTFSHSFPSYYIYLLCTYL